MTNPENRVEVDAAIADILVSCPIPGKSNEQMRFGDFVNSEQGKNFGNSVINIYNMFTETGMDKQAAISNALGAAAVRDEDTNEIVYRQAEPVAVADVAPEPTEIVSSIDSKKKLI